ncbi:MAG: hypothetical protein JSS27_05335 [Planctomycetes bacterium]|nr:hypothetical protein [Planctomycetota bacterium]
MGSRWERAVWYFGIVVGLVLLSIAALLLAHGNPAEQHPGTKAEWVTLWSFALLAPFTLLPAVLLAHRSPISAGVLLIMVGMLSLAPVLFPLLFDLLEGKRLGELFDLELIAYLLTSPVPALAFGIFYWRLGCSRHAKGIEGPLNAKDGLKDV